MLEEQRAVVGRGGGVVLRGGAVVILGERKESCELWAVGSGKWSCNRQ
jgi:hypothetical protein